jgi:N-acetylglucosamine-6-phosphate deacetylase
VPSLAASRLLTPAGMVDDAVVTFDDHGTITAIEPATRPVPDRILTPGFVDVQVNGIDDVDCSRAEGADWDRLDQLLVAQGVTTWCPTLVTMPLDRFAAPLARIRAAMDRPAAGRPQIAGAHLEGPFLGGAPGAHRPEMIVPVDLAWLGSLPSHVAVVTLAAEQPEAAEAIRLLCDRGVLVSVGHTTASHEQVTAAIDAGARLATHLFNGMTGLHHRDPGVAASVLAHPTVAASLIADGVHVHPRMLLLASRLLGERMVLVTDAVAWRRGSVGPVGLELRDGAARLPNGTLAGSAVPMHDSIRVCVEAGIPLVQALRAASATPAALLGLADRGIIEVGRRADLVALTPDLELEQTFVAGLPAT